MATVVLGLGNILLGDEGVGVRVVEALSAGYDLPPEVAVIDGGTSGMDMMDMLAGLDALIVADALRTDKPPGTIVHLTGDAVPALFRTRISPHQLGLSEVLGALQLLGEGPKSLSLIGVAPLDLDLGLALSPTVAAQVAPMVDIIVGDLRDRGHAVTRKPADA